MASPSSCEVIVFDGEPRPLRSCHVENNADTDGTSEIAGVRVVESHPVTAEVETTRVMDLPAQIQYVHISSDEYLYMLEDAFVSSSNATVGETFGDVSLTANTLSIRALHHKL